MTIRICNLRDKLLPGDVVVNTTSHAKETWMLGLSPFHLGPCTLYGGFISQTMENAWQYAKVYHDHLDADGNPSPAYWTWARMGWARPRAERYPKGKGAKPAYLWWDGEKLDYVAARKKVYWPTYRDAVARSDAFARLEQVYRNLQPGQRLVLQDFDGYDDEAPGRCLADVVENTTRPMGHAFVLKAMLLYGRNVRPEDLPRTPGAPDKPQLQLL